MFSNSPCSYGVALIMGQLILKSWFIISKWKICFVLCKFFTGFSPIVPSSLSFSIIGFIFSFIKILLTSKLMNSSKFETYKVSCTSYGNISSIIFKADFMRGVVSILSICLHKVMFSFCTIILLFLCFIKFIHIKNLAVLFPKVGFIHTKGN